MKGRIFYGHHFPRVSGICLAIFRALGQAVNVLLVALWLAVRFVPQFCVPSQNGHEFGLIVDGDEMCFATR